MYKDKDKQREANAERQRRYREKALGVTIEGVTPEKEAEVTPKAEGVTNPCVYCGKQLEFAILKCCYNCALEQPSKPVSPATDGHTLASRPALEFTGKMTDFEREHYKPASKLKPGQYNPVSKPGDSHYGQG